MTGCAECGSALSARPRGRGGSPQRFCSPGCKSRWHNRARSRGLKLLMLKMAERYDRHGKIDRTRTDAYVTRCRIEDERAGRASWLPDLIPPDVRIVG